MKITRICWNISLGFLCCFLLYSINHLLGCFCKTRGLDWACGRHDIMLSLALLCGTFSGTFKFLHNPPLFDPCKIYHRWSASAISWKSFQKQYKFFALSKNHIHMFLWCVDHAMLRFRIDNPKRTMTYYNKDLPEVERANADGNWRLLNSPLVQIDYQILDKKPQISRTSGD